ncbi:hypothetical protein U3516DRAFT_762067 [Neocallimastix sp. 'constans']
MKRQEFINDNFFNRYDSLLHKKIRYRLLSNMDLNYILTQNKNNNNNNGKSNNKPHYKNNNKRNKYYYNGNYKRNNKYKRNNYRKKNILANIVETKNFDNDSNVSYGEAFVNDCNQTHIENNHPINTNSKDALTLGQLTQAGGTETIDDIGGSCITTNLVGDYYGYINNRAVGIIEVAFVSALTL